MREFSFKITDEVGIHARPAGLLVKKASEFESAITIKLGEKSADAKKIFSVMSLGAKKDDDIIVTISGSDEDNAFSGLKMFFSENL
jgi:phosphocarrier protein